MDREFENLVAERQASTYNILVNYDVHSGSTGRSPGPQGGPACGATLRPSGSGGTP